MVVFLYWNKTKMSDQTPVAETTESLPLPRIIYGEGADPSVLVDPNAAAQTMRELGVSEASIFNSAVYIDPKNRLANHGTHYTPRLGRWRFRSVPELQDVKGNIVRVSTTVRSKARTAEQINRTATHEWEHLAQADRHDRKVTEGHIAIYGLAALGALAGSKLGKSGTAIGGLLGYQLGYRFAPHERQARRRAGQGRGWSAQVTTSAVSRKTK